MSKRSSTGQANTLYNYFISPKSKPKATSPSSVTENPNLRKSLADMDPREFTWSNSPESTATSRTSGRYVRKTEYRSQPVMDLDPLGPSTSSQSLQTRRSPAGLIHTSDSDSDEQTRQQPTTSGSSSYINILCSSDDSSSPNRNRAVVGTSDSEDSSGHLHPKAGTASTEDMDRIDICPEPSVQDFSRKRMRATCIQSDSSDSDVEAAQNVSVAMVHYPESTPEDYKGKQKMPIMPKLPIMPRMPQEDKGKKQHVKKRRRIVPTDSDPERKELSEAVSQLLKSYSHEQSSGDPDLERIINKPLTGGQIEDETVDTSSSGSDNSYFHEKLDFLQPEHICDINKNRLGDPNYDGRTLYVPEDFLKKQTPAMHQWWNIKRKHYDTVLLFKVGKFYELYHMDATIGVASLQLAYMKGEHAHCGFPEVVIGRMASSLVEQGFKVTRVEQTETPEMMAQRCRVTRKTSRMNRVVNREVCQVMTKGTCVYGVQLADAKDSAPAYMLAIVEKTNSNGRRFGICFIETSIGEFNLGEFDDDKYYSRLLALLAEHSPSLILTERGHLQMETLKVLKNAVGDARRDTLAPTTEFYTAENTLSLLRNACYFRDENNEFHWPSALYKFLDGGSAKVKFELAIRALGACLWYLKDSELDIQIFTMKKFRLYEPADTINMETAMRDYMVLDSVTMHNLSLLGAEGTLQNTIDFCITPFGKRMLKRWICRPLCIHDRIRERQAAVQELSRNNELRNTTRTILKQLPDLERQVAKIHSFGNKFFATNHPDGRAIYYEATIYSKRKITELLGTLDGFEATLTIPATFKDCESCLLKKLSRFSNGGGIFPNLTESINYFKTSFDQPQAHADGKIIPTQGVDKDYDQAQLLMTNLQAEIDGYLKEQERYFGCKLTYFGTDKKRYQIQVPEAQTKKATAGYQFEGSRKGKDACKRYTTATTRKFLTDMLKAEASINKILLDLNRRIFEQFSKRRDKWEQCIQCMMILDALCSLAEYNCRSSRTMCFPTILPRFGKPRMIIEEGVHPCSLLDDFVPNTTELGTKKKPSLMILTGPNMGGKSTLMRQVGLIVILAQMGCPVPAVNCELSLVDRIFTRLGACDDILRGQSTFLVELSEASSILQHAAEESLVLVDELGRGTSTYDGCAIATAYVLTLSEIKCRAIFATHYHSLVDFFTDKNYIQLAHMACLVESDKKEDDNDAVTLLYQLKRGNCPKSYGFNAARMAGFPNSLISRAREISKRFEDKKQLHTFIRKLCVTDAETARKMIDALEAEETSI